MADAFGPARAAVARAHVGVARKGRRLGVRTRQRFPLAVEAVGHPGAVVAGAVFSDALDEQEILVGALDAIDAGAFEEIVLGLVQDDDRFVEAAREVREGRAAAIHAAVVVGEKQIRVGVVADDPVVEPAFDDALGRALEEVLRRAPRHRVLDVVGGREARLLRLEDHIPFLLRSEIEDLRRAVVAAEIGILVEVEGLGLGRLVPAGEVEIGHAPAFAPCGGGEDVPAAVVENDGGVLHGDDRVVRVGRRINERAGGGPGPRGERRQGGARRGSDGGERRRRSAGAAAFPDPVVVKVHTAAGGLGRIIEEGEAITHEVRHGVFKGRGTTDGGPGFAVEAVGEAGDFRRGLKFAFDLEVNGFAREGNGGDFLGFVGVGAHHDERPAPLLAV